MRTCANICAMPRITLILTDEELSTLKHKAGLVPLSRWIRNLALTEGGESRRADSGLRGEMAHSAEMPTPPKPIGKPKKHYTDTW